MTILKEAATAGLLMIFLGCSGPRAFTRGEYQDPNTIEMLSDQFNENDLQLIAKKIVASLMTSPALGQIQGQPVIVVGRMKNSSSEHIDMRSLSDKLEVELIKTGRFSFLDKNARDEIAEEYEYQAGYADPTRAKKPGQQVAADFLLTGEISSIVQEVGADKLVYYKMTAKLHNLKTGVIDWADEKELRKKFAKQGVSW